jgi:rhamnose utilization protein RhaD (predicted bifunctional aldolase and dehydrogenase)
VIRGLASTDRPRVGHYTDSEVVLDFVSRTEHPRLAALGTSCPDHFLRTKVRPMVGRGQALDQHRERMGRHRYRHQPGVKGTERQVW